MKILLLLVAVLIIALVLRAGQLFNGTPPYASPESNLTVAPMRLLAHGYITTFKEKPLLSYIGLWIYHAGRHIGLTFDQSLILLLCVFVAISIAVVFLFTKRITGSTSSAIYAAMLLAIMPTAVQAQLLNVWVGDFFVSILAMVAVFLLVLAFDSYKCACRALILAAASIIPLIFSYFLWNGGLYAAAAYGFTLVILIIGRTKTLQHIAAEAVVVVGLLLLIFPLTPMYVWTDISYPHAALGSGISTVIGYNILSFATQQTMLNIRWITPLVIVAAVAGFLVFVFPIIWLLLMYRGRASSALIAVFCSLLVGMPLALLNIRFESLIIMPIAILAAVGISTFEFKHKTIVYALFIGIIALFAVLEVWPYFAWY